MSELSSRVDHLQQSDALAKLDPALEQRLQRLLGEVRSQLQQRSLSPEIQRELAQLLGLLPQLGQTRPQLLDMVEAAIATLLDHAPSNGAIGEIVSEQPRDQQRNLVFARETRRQIDLASQDYPHPIRAVLFGVGGAYNRLISGLSWFFLLFVVTPLLGAGLMAFTLRVLGSNELQNTLDQLQQVEEKFQRQQASLTTSELQKNTLENTLRQVQEVLAKTLTDGSVPAGGSEDSVGEGSNGSDPAIDSSGAETGADSGVNNNESNNESVPETLTLTADQLMRWRALQAKVTGDLELIAVNPSAAESGRTGEGNLPDRSGAGAIAPRQIQPSPSPTPGLRSENASNLEKQSIYGFFIANGYFIAMAVSMGALGSAVSVIVRSGSFIEQAKERGVDLFFTGFFRPFVGMSFAIFAVALVESGVFSGIFQVPKSEGRNVYLYMTIAFIAGFSERLVQDVVIRTEDTIAGAPRSRDS